MGAIAHLVESERMIVCVSGALFPAKQRDNSLFAMQSSQVNADLPLD